MTWISDAIDFPTFLISKWTLLLIDDLYFQMTYTFRWQLFLDDHDHAMLKKKHLLKWNPDNQTSTQICVIYVVVLDVMEMQFDILL